MKVCMTDLQQEQVPFYLRYAYAGIPAHLKATANALALHADKITGRCYPSKERLAFFSTNCAAKLKKDFLELETIGLLARTYRKGSSTIYWLHPDPQKLFPCPLKSKMSDLNPDEKNPFEQVSSDPPNDPPVDNSPKSYPQPGHPVATPGHPVATPQPPSSHRTVSELCITTTATENEIELLKKQAFELCKQKRPDLQLEAVWDKFTAFYTNKGKEITLEKWDAWVTKERYVPQNGANASQNRELSKQEECAIALKAFGIDLYTTRENREINEWWAWMDQNPNRRIA